MAKSKTITLVAPQYRVDALKQRVPDGEQLREVFCQIDSISRAEWHDAAQKGLKAAYKVTVWPDEYQGEVTAILDGKRYGIYRTYQSDPDNLELYLERKAGA